MKVLVIGGGIGGLTAAIAMREHGIEVEIHEAARSLSDVGAGITLGRGAQHVFRALDLQSDVAARACPAGALPFLHHRSGKILMGAPDNGDGTPDDGAADIPRHIYRGDLQTVLIQRARDLGVRIYSGHRLTGFEQDARSVTALFANGKAVGDILLGADGVRSAVRAAMPVADEPRFTNHVAYRFLVPRERAAPFMSAGRSAIFIGPHRTFNRYTMCRGEIVNCAGLVETGERVAEGWSIAAGKDEIETAFAGWHPDVLGLIERGDAAIKWGLYDRAPLTDWVFGRVTLLGDAAHAMLPFLGMGAAMAVEDGYVFAQALASEADPTRALARYAAARKPRTDLVHARSAEQGRITQALDPDAIRPGTVPMNDEAMMGFNPVTAPI